MLQMADKNVLKNAIQESVKLQSCANKTNKDKNFIFTKNDYLCPCRQRFTDKTHVKRLTLCSTYRLLRMPQSDGKYSYSQKSAQRAAYSEG